MEKQLKQPVVIVNKTGAGGAVGMQALAVSKLDGYTPMVALSSISVMPEVDAMFGRPPVYKLSDFALIALLSAAPTVLIVSSKSPWKGEKAGAFSGRKESATPLSRLRGFGFAVMTGRTDFRDDRREKGMQRIGLIGLGLMGRQLGRRLMLAGFPLRVWNRSRQKAEELLTAGALWSESPADLARQVDVVITIVTDSAASEAVICGPGGVLEGAHPDLVLIDMASIAPEMSRSIAARAKAKGVTMLDAPVTGNPKVASEGKLGIMAGGPKETFSACLPIFETMGVKIIHVGEANGLGTTLKLINNLVMGVAIEAVAEALVLAGKAGIDPQKVIEITSVGGARTGAMETRGGRMIHHDFSPHFSANNMYKDLFQALKLADEVGAFLPAAGVSLEMLRAVKNQGKGDLDSASVITVIEAMANTVVKTGG